MEHITVAKREKIENSGKESHTDAHVTLFRHIVNSEMRQSEISDDRLVKEAQVLLGGGTASTARTLGFISYYILANPQIRQKLQDELEHPMNGWPEKIPSWADLEKLPYLQALIKEGFR
jgi:cytochrome P450